ncbi:MAG TPA: toll/interleukin-1 receptor domain-containing protein [Longimicrobium sp.]|nr:toll/interleukin-1 receptor domain-containing protein [Longimicrobium sp.]
MILLNPPRPRWDLFIAYARADGAEAEALYDLLASELNVFLDSRSLQPGDDWPRVLPAALRASPITVVLVSPRVDMAYYANEEIAIAIDLARRYPDRYRVVPVVVEDPDEQRSFLPFGLRSKHGLFARTPEERASAVRRLVALAAGSGAAAGTRWDDVWGPEPADSTGPQPGAEQPVVYPPLRFLTDHGEEVLVRDPAALADLLERNPENGRLFLYRRYYERAGWDAANPGLCAALAVLIEQRFADNPAAGLTAALYLLDPRRPYRGGGELVDGYLPLATHLAAHAHTYRDALRDQRHPLWLYLASRPEPAAREGVRAFAAAFSSLPNDSTLEAAAVTLNRLIVWLRGMSGRTGLPFGATGLGTPADILALPRAERAAAAASLADRASLLSVWVEERAPELSRLAATWRRTHPGDLPTLPFALGVGVAVGPGEVRGPEDVVAGAAGVAEALWAEDADDLRGRVSRYLATFHFVPLAGPALDRLRTVKNDPYALAVAAYVADHLAELPDAAGSTDEGKDGEAAGVGDVAPVVFRALDAGAGRGTPPDAAARVADTLAGHAGRRLLAPEAAQGALARLSAFLEDAARHVDGAAGRPGERALWARFLARTDDTLRRAWRDGIAEPGLSPAGLRDADARIARALDALRAHGAAPPFGERHARERAAGERLGAAIDERVAAERGETLAALDADERAARAFLRRRAGSVPPLLYASRAVDRARRATLLLLLGAALFGAAQAVLLVRYAGLRADYDLLFPDQPVLPEALYSSMFYTFDEPNRFVIIGLLVAGFVALVSVAAGTFLALAGGRAHPLPVAVGTVASVAVFLAIGVYLASRGPVTASITGVALAVAALALCARSWRRWRAWSAEARAHRERLDAHPVMAAAFGQRRAAMEAHAGGHALAWTAVLRRTLARAEAPETVELPPAPPRDNHPAAGSKGVESAMETVVRMEAAPAVGGGVPAARAPSRLRRAAVLAGGAGAGVVLIVAAVRVRVDAYALTVQCDDRARVEAMTLQYQQYDARMEFEDDTTRGSRRWSMVMDPLPRAVAERIEYQANEWKSFAPGECYASAIWKP